MIIIYKELVRKYISNLTPNHIKKYSSSINYILTEEEVSMIYQFIRNYYEELLEDESTIYKLKGQVRDDLYNKIVELYKENKAKYLS